MVAVNEISVDAVVAVVLSELECIFHIKRKKNGTVELLWSKRCFFLLWICFGISFVKHRSVHCDLPGVVPSVATQTNREPCTISNLLSKSDWSTLNVIDTSLSSSFWMGHLLSSILYGPFSRWIHQISLGLRNVPSGLSCSQISAPKSGRYCMLDWEMDG